MIFANCLASCVIGFGIGFGGRAAITQIGFYAKVAVCATGVPVLCVRLQGCKPKLRKKTPDVVVVVVDVREGVDVVEAGLVD